MKSGSVSKYPVMSLEEICNLPVEKVADKDSVLFLWVPTPLLPDGLKVMESWGFKYKTAIYWVKDGRLGMGFYYRNQVEVCLVGVKGKVKAFRCQKPNYVIAKVTRHSEKPEVVRQLIEESTIGLEPKIELFGRKEVDGWIVLGNEIDVRDIREALEEMVC